MKFKTVFLLSAALLMIVSMSWAQLGKVAPDPAVASGSCDPVLANWGLDQVVWSTVPSATPFSRAASGVIGHYMYNFGSEGSNLAQAYNLDTDTWQQSTPCPQGYDNWCGTVANDELYVVSRYDGAFHQDFYRFTPTGEGPTGTWTTLAPFPILMSYAVCIAWDGGNYIYAGGGDASIGYAYRYDISANTWSALPNMPGPAGYAGGAYCQGKFYVVGGVTGSGNANYEYDPVTNTWATRAPVPVVPWFEVFQTTSDLQYVILLGGGGGYSIWPAINNVQLYDPITNTWTQETPLPFAGGNSSGNYLGNAYSGQVLSSGGYSAGQVGNTYRGVNMPGGLPESVPAAVEGFTVDDNGASLIASLSWTNPTTTVGGDPLTTIDSVIIERDGALLTAFTNATPGQAMSHDDATIPVAGTYAYTVVCANDSGRGVPSSATVWIGPDVPNGVNTLLMTPAENYALQATLTWVNPTSGAHGGFFPGITGYNIERSDGATFDLVGQATQYVDNTIPEAGYYHYTVTPYNNSGEGLATESNEAWIGVPQIWTWEEIPYVWNDISGVGTNAGITGDDQNVGPFALGFTFEFFDGQEFSSIYLCSNGWQSFTSTVTIYSNVGIPNTAEPNNLIAPFWDDLYPPSGGTVYYYQDTMNSRFVIQYTAIPHIGGQGPFTFQTVINEEGSIEFFYNNIGGNYNTDCTVGIENGTGTDGIQVCYMGAGNFLPTTGSAIRFNPPLAGAPGQPNVVSDLTAFAGLEGALSCSLSWVNPTIDALGQPLTELLGAKVVRMDTIVAVIPSDMGETVTFVDNTLTDAGLYVYTVYGYNTEYDGLPTTTDPIWIGEDIPGAVDNLWMEPAPNYGMFATLTWDNPTAGAHGGYFTTILGYSIERSDGATFDLVGEATTYVDNAIPVPDYYSYTVTPYNASGEGPTVTSNVGYVGPPQIYTWEEIPYEWDDISGIGTPVTLTDDQNAGPFDMGMDFEYYETFFNTIRICSNGFLSFTSTSNSLSEQQMPDPLEPNNTLAFFWDDLNPSMGGTVHYYYNATEHKFTVQFTNIPHYSTGGPYTMQAVLRQDGTISYYYNTINPPNNSCAVGCENATGTEGVLVCYDGTGAFLPVSQSAVRINPPVRGFGQVSGTVTLDGAVGNITNVQVADNFGASTFCESNGDYTLDSARAGDNFITASLEGFFYDSTRYEVVYMDSFITDVDFTLRRLEPSIPTGLAAAVDTANGHVVLTWDTHPDPSVDLYLLQRMHAGGQWAALAVVPVPTVTYTDPLSATGQYFYRISASDVNVIPPPSQSAWSDPVEAIWGELPPENLTAAGNYDDRIRLNWTAPGGGGGPGVVSILVVDDDGSANNGGTYTAIENIFFNALEDAGYEYDVFDVDWSITSPPQSGPTAAEMADYDVVIWFAGETWGYYGADVLTPTDEANLGAYLDGGGNLFLSAQDYFYGCYPGASSFSPGQFPYDYLGISTTIQDYWDLDLTWNGATGSFAAGMTFNTLNPFAGSSLYADLLSGMSGIPLLTNGGQPSATQYDAGDFKVAFTTLSFAGLLDGTAPSTKAQFMENMISWMGSRTAGIVKASARPSIPPIAESSPASRSASSLTSGVKDLNAKAKTATRTEKSSPVMAPSITPAGPVGEIVHSAKAGFRQFNEARNYLAIDASARNGSSQPPETDQVLLYYKIYRDGAYLDTSYATQHFDIGTVENVDYDYYVTGFYDNGVESGATNTVTAMCNMAPAAPGNFVGVANVTEDSMILTWNDPTLNADGSPCVDLALLKIYRDGEFVADVNPGVRRYADAPPNLTRTYTWTVTAQDEVPNVSAAASFVGSVQSPWNEVPYFWIEISTIGTNTGITGDDQNLGPFPMGFDFNFYGNVYNSIRVCSNGFLSFTSTSTVYTNTAIPNPAEPNNMVAPFWDDLYPPTGGAIYYYYDQGSGWFIVEYQNVPHISEGGPYTFEVILTPDDAIYVNYQTINDPNNSCTVGVENATGTMAVQVCFDGSGDFLPHSSSSIAFWAGPPPQGDMEGYVYENATPNDPIPGAMVICGIDTAYTDNDGYYHGFNILEGTYDAVASSFGYNSETETMEIVSGETTEQDFYLTQPILSVDVSSIEVGIAAGGSHQETFNISNLGDGTLDFNIEIEQGARIVTRAHFPKHQAVPTTSSGARKAKTPVRVAASAISPVQNSHFQTFSSESDAAPVHVPYRPMNPEPFSFDEILWTQKANMPTARYSGVSGTYNGEIFIAQGRISDSSPYNTAVVEAYDYTDDSWRTNCTSAPTARRMAAFGAMYEDEYLFVVGGRDNNSSTVGTLEIYNMATDTWTTGPACSGRWAHGGAVLDGYVYVFGSDGSLTPNTSTQRYDIAGGSWQTMATMPMGDGWVCGAAAAGKVYCIGGSSSSTAMREYDPASNTWSLKASCPHGRTYATAIGANDLVYVVGGDLAGNIVDVYDPETDTWVTETNLPNTISWAQMAVSPAFIYVIGGTPTSSPVVYQNRVWAGQVGEPQEPWLFATPETGTVEPQESQLITLDFLMPDTAHYGDVYTADVIVENNTITPSITIPVTVNIVESVIDPEVTLPLNYALYQNYPNPFNPTTRIRFDLRERSRVVLEVFNILGQKVTTVLDGTMEAGQHFATFDASKLASGVYFYRITANDFKDLKKMVLVR